MSCHGVWQRLKAIRQLMWNADSSVRLYVVNHPPINQPSKAVNVKFNLNIKYAIQKIRAVGTNRETYLVPLCKWLIHRGCGWDSRHELNQLDMSRIIYFVMVKVFRQIRFGGHIGWKL